MCASCNQSTLVIFGQGENIILEEMTLYLIWLVLRDNKTVIYNGYFLLSSQILFHTPRCSLVTQKERKCVSESFTPEGLLTQESHLLSLIVTKLTDVKETREEKLVFLFN